MPSHSKSSKRWLREHFNDPFVKQAQQQGYRSRAAFKLLEIQQRDRIISPGMCIVDLGAAPGGWSQIAAKLLGGKGDIIALDILPMEPISGVKFIQGDFTATNVYDELVNALSGRAADLVLSDIAPNASGNKSIDQPRANYLAELALDFAVKTLKPGGDLLMKVFQGSGTEQLIKDLRKLYEQVMIRKPSASRARSAEVYLLAKGLRSS